MAASGGVWELAFDDRFVTEFVTGEKHPRIGVRAKYG